MTTKPALLHIGSTMKRWRDVHHSGARRRLAPLPGLVIVSILTTLTGCEAPAPAPTPAHAPTTEAPVAFRQPEVVPVADPPTAPAVISTASPASVDLRPALLALGLGPRPQGPRGTCSIFTTCEAIEFAFVRSGVGEGRLSPEYLNWAAGDAAGAPSDGNFFHNALNGFAKRGICTEALMPYQPAFDAARGPSAEAMTDAARALRASAGLVTVHWIVPWKPDHFGVNDEQFAEVKSVLIRGFPVAAGSGHSRLLVGFRDDPGAAGGGVFITEDSALNRFDEVTYEFVRKQVADVFWVEGVKPAGGRAEHLE